MASTWTVRKNIIALSAFEMSHGSNFWRIKNSSKDLIPGTRSAWVATCMCQWGPTTVRIAGLDNLRKPIVLERRISFATVGFGIRKSIGFGLGKSTSFAIRKSIGLAMRKSIGFVMWKSLNQSFVRSLLCGEHSSMGKCAELWERDFFDLQKMHLPQLEREWFVEFSENAFTSLITTASSLVAA